mmetsp:Transcript_22391/g.28987  ORF Transcript_22391/g.28987 Transcript_22391/m.28987 type:complete len:917 (-) Transcript_22391:557-3307(-)|eukprot:CAMPEP_0197311774 /NCGR_PEP_ID=MMETSP0891-20130614/14840_1 /TAXON_ID=44058 ORGANISM="Aureoumbra lagunensis, Strain CCMP1510" /NCGR_SAMPLE_ID=MMETSP0891 /ASSEMBLY_ACC=CAM_ASM_000534 /LENGTH=916 /DNA_ID=CAMNT_0042798339 /DNA_START=68 /DNA_END=2818 /DNA_ORIENTATION=+
MTAKLRFISALLLVVSSLSQEVEIEVTPDVDITQRPQYLYSHISPKMRINGHGFGKDPSQIKLDFIPPLMKKSKPTYNLSCTDTVLVLGLKKGMEWPVSSNGDGSSTLFLQSIIVEMHGPKNQLAQPIPVATVIEPPSVIRGEDKLIYMTGTARFLINGTGFREGSMSLVFDPPLVRDVDYVLAVRSNTVIQLALRTGRKWRSDGEPGPLKLRRIDSGAGPLRIDPKFGGVVVAEVQADLGGHGVTVTANPDLIIYQTDPSLIIQGSGFKSVEGFGNPRLRFGNGLLGRGTNYSISEFSDDRMELVLKPMSNWRKNGANLPAPLTLLAVDAGSGYVAVGATEARKGVRVATVFEAPVINPSPLTSLFRTHSAQLWITGVGFTRPGSSPGFNSEMKLEFEPALKSGTDYVLTVFNRTHALMRLREGRAWSNTPGPLYVTSCDTGPGLYVNFKPVAVAHIVPDAETDKSGLEVTRTNHQVLYQTPAIRHLEIHGASLSMNAKLVFQPPLTLGVDYKVLRATDDLMILGLLKGHMWRQTAGPLSLMSVDTGKGPVSFAHGAGIVVADIMANPTVATSSARLTASTTKRLSIYGTGFSIDGTEITLEPTSRSAYDIEAVYENEVILKLKDGKSWGSVPSGKDTVDLVATKIDTAAGEYIFQDGTGKAQPIVVGIIVPDAAASTDNGQQIRCDDTCMWANDGVCDDGSRGRGKGGGMKEEKGAGAGAGAWWEDDDLGGWYSDEHDMQYEDKYDYGYYDDQYGYYGDDTAMPACILGTDCTDCGGPLSALDFVSTEKQGDWDDDEWFDDDNEEWWDDDYDFGDGWSGFEDDDKVNGGIKSLGIIQSKKSNKKPNKRHRPRGSKNKDSSESSILSTYPVTFSIIALIGVVAAYFGWSSANKNQAPDAPPANLPCFGPRKQAQA